MELSRDKGKDSDNDLFADLDETEVCLLEVLENLRMKKSNIAVLHPQVLRIMNIIWLKK